LINLSRYTLNALRKDQDFILYRGQSTLDLSRILVLAPAAERPGPECLRRLAHEYSLRQELNPAWAAGGTAGIGRATAVAFARQGAWVVVSGRRETEGKESVALIEKAGGEGLAQY